MYKYEIMDLMGNTLSSSPEYNDKKRCHDDAEAVCRSFVESGHSAYVKMITL